MKTKLKLFYNKNKIKFIYILNLVYNKLNFGLHGLLLQIGLLTKRLNLIQPLNHILLQSLPHSHLRRTTSLTSSVVKLLLPLLWQAPIASILSPPPDLLSPSQPWEKKDFNSICPYWKKTILLIPSLFSLPFCDCAYIYNPPLIYYILFYLINILISPIKLINHNSSTTMPHILTLTNEISPGPRDFIFIRKGYLPHLPLMILKLKE